MKKQRKGIITTLIIGSILCLSFLSISDLSRESDAAEPFFTLVFKTNGGGVRPTYGSFLRQQLARIGIDVDIVILDWSSFIAELVTYQDYDICYYDFSTQGLDIDMTEFYSENGSQNIFGYDTSLDFNEELGTGINEWYLRNGTEILPSNSTERIMHYWNWERHMMDIICPMVPVFANDEYLAYWNNLQGYNISKGLLQSWGNMSWTGSHLGQVSTNEVVITDKTWLDLNPMYQDDDSSKFITKACLDPLFWVDANQTLWPHIAKNHQIINDTIIDITIRDGIIWTDDPDGLFSNELLNAEDLYFTFYCMKYLSNNKNSYDAIEDLQIINSTSLRITTTKPYAPIDKWLTTLILPEHFLNQTQLASSRTPDIAHPSWNTFANNSFGTGLFELTNFNQSIETILSVNPNSWWLNTSIINDIHLNWENRFGDFIPLIDQLRIRIIPDLQTSLLEFEAGKVDLHSIAEFPDKRDYYLADADLDVLEGNPTSFGFFGFNMRETRTHLGNRDPSPIDPTITKGLAIRKAIAYAVDRVEINNVIHRGEYTLTNWPINPKMVIWCNPNIIRYNHDLDKAREFMVKAGFEAPWAPTSDGFFHGLFSIGMIIIYASFGGILVISLSIIIPKKIRKKRRRNTPLMNKPKSFFIDEQYEK